ncbi:MAG: methylmalonyl-CoA epimerase [Candidatus Aminicenantales bacterium]
MKIKKIDHIGIAVKNIEKSLTDWESLFGLRAGKIEKIKDRNVKLIHLEFEDGPSVELVSPLAEDAAVAKFLNERGEGIHHVCVIVDDIQEAMEALKKKGLQFVQEEPEKGAGGSRIAFIHPRSLNGVLLELKQEAE